MIRYLGVLVIMLLFLASCTSTDDSEPEILLPNLELVVLDNQEPVPNATIKTEPETETAITDAKGYVIFKNIEPGDYLVKIYVEDLEYHTDVTVALKGENKYTIALESIDPIGQAPVDYDELFKSIYAGLKSEALFDARSYVGYWGDIGADVCYVNPNIY